MYPPYAQTVDYQYQPDNYYQGYNERLFGQWFPSPGGHLGPPPGPPPGPPHGQPSGPPFGPPPGPPVGPQPPWTPPGPTPDVGPPTSPPPSYIPTQAQQVGTFAVDPGGIRGCLFRYTYIWLRNRQQFWYYPTFVGRRSVSGYRWTGFRWVYFGVSLREITSFQCV
ncbi:hypothetical protein BKP45_06000 [Anaerobacillus alkalidiazotrophicus]|uniref:Transporter n=1 Tax=Anaerobacillus alkalidiazotrophicus TaxID=472963 RepID=A0A1S2MCN4_9BACI|nr:hypothetical protein BKP45_06000 [Anaerobacillus alkalidiazotrophicus]